MSDRGGASERLSLAIANWGLDRTLTDPEGLLFRYHALVGWAEAIARAGADAVTVVQRFGRSATIQRNGVEYVFVADGAKVAARFAPHRAMSRAVAQRNPDVVHVNGCIFPMLVRDLRRKLPRRTAIVVQDHGGSGIQDHLPGFRNVPWQLWHRFGLRAADAFLFTARPLSLPWLRAGIIADAERIHEIPEASTELASLSTAPEATPRLPGRPALLWVARLDANKDPLTVLAGFEEATAAIPDAALTMAFGDDVLLPEVTARIARSPGLRARVHLRGPIERTALAALYRGADLFVIGSHREVASFALIEALSFGVVPAVTDIPPFRALTDGGRLGALFPPGDASALARSLKRLAATDLCLARSAVRAHFERELSWAAVGRKALAIYRATLAARRALLTAQGSSPMP